MCSCINVEMGSYDNQVLLKSWWGNDISVDRCIVTDILCLWGEEIRTTGCCCGHNKVVPMINVAESEHEKMVELGYEFWTNKFGVLCYKPKFIT